MTSALVRSSGWPVSKVCSARADAATSPFFRARLCSTIVTMAYINGLSEAVRRILIQLDIKVVFRPLGTLRHMLVHSKDPVPLDQQKGVVYSIPCDQGVHWTDWPIPQTSNVMVYPSLFLYYFHWLVFPCSYLIGGTIPTSLLVLVKNMFTPLLSDLFMEC